MGWEEDLDVIVFSMNVLLSGRTYFSCMCGHA